MSQTIIYSNYKFDITIDQSKVHIKVFDTVSMDLYEGTVNEQEIYVNPISKFAKMLTGALAQEKDFSIGIDKCPDKLKCHLTYKTDFIELEEIFSLDQVANTQAVEYHMRDKISTLESNDVQIEKLIGLLTAQVDKLTEQVAGLVKENQQLKETMAQREVIEVLCFPPGQPGILKYVPVNNVYLQLETNQLSVQPISPVPYASGFSSTYSASEILNKCLNFNFKRICICPCDQNCHSQLLNEFLNNYLLKTKKQIDEIIIRAGVYAGSYFETLKKYSNYKKIKISVQDAHYDKLHFDLHCKTNNIEIEYV